MVKIDTGLAPAAQRHGYKVDPDQYRRGFTLGTQHRYKRGVRGLPKVTDSFSEGYVDACEGRASKHP